MTKLIVENVGKEFAAADRALVVLRDVSFELAEADNLAIVGPSGSGKSTLLGIIGTLQQPSSGRVLFNDRDTAELSGDELAEFRNRRVGFVFQDHHLLPQCSVLENVLVPTIVSAREAADRARRLLARVGLEEHLARRPGQLSGGECQRVALVRALINEPRLLLADEPTGALDHTTAGELGQLLLELNREEQVTLICVTHSRELADQLDRVLHLQDGTLGDSP